jgi:hypothetical protein
MTARWRRHYRNLRGALHFARQVLRDLAGDQANIQGSLDLLDLRAFRTCAEG